MMIDVKILQFLALSALMFACSEAYYPYGQQHYSSHHGNPNNNYNNIHRGNYNQQNGNYNSINSNYNNNNNNINNIDYNSNNINHNNNNNNNKIYNSRHNANSNNNNNNNKNPVLAINLPKTFLGDFEYVPTLDGYRFSYELIDGTRRTETGFIPNTANSGAYKQDERATAERTAIRMRSRANSKNRKLSPKSLQSLAG